LPLGVDRNDGGTDGAMGAAWKAHHLQTTSNFGRKDWLLCWHLGRLDFPAKDRPVAKGHRSHYRSLELLGRQPLAAAA